MLHIPLVLVIVCTPSLPPSLVSIVGRGLLCQQCVLLHRYSFQQTSIHLAFLAWERKDPISLEDYGRRSLQLSLSLTWPLYHFSIRNSQLCPVLTQLKIGQGEEDRPAP